MTEAEFELVEHIITQHLESARDMIINAVAAISEAGSKEES